MFIALEIIAHLLEIFIIAGIAALIWAAISYWRSRDGRKTKAALLSPFVFFYTFYFCGLIGAFTASAIFHTGCGLDGYWHAYLPNGYEIYSTMDDSDYTAWSSIIQKGDSSIIYFVAEIKEEDNMIYGMYYPVSEIPGAGIYFSLDTGNGTFTQYGMLEEERANENVVSGLLDIKSFYRSKWGWVMPLIVLSLLAAIGATWGVRRWITGTKKGGKR